MAKNKAKKKVLITGGMGFIGRSLVNKLLAETRDTLYIVDDLSSSSATTSYTDNPRITFFNTNLTDWQPPKDVVFDKIYHLAGPVGPVRVLKFSGRIAEIIISHLYKMAYMASEMKAKLLFISTSEVYGAHALGGTAETQQSVIPSNITVRLEYGTAKLMGEIILKNLSTVIPLKHNCVRPFNIVGPGQNGKSGFVIPRFTEMALEDKPITVYGTGDMVRTFTHIEDFVDAIVSIMNSRISGEVFNIGNPENTISINHLAQEIIATLKSNSKIKFVDPKKLHGKSFEDAWDKIPDITKIKKMIGWEPKRSMNDIINEVAQDAKNSVSNKKQDFSI